MLSLEAFRRRRAARVLVIIVCAGAATGCAVSSTSPSATRSPEGSAHVTLTFTDGGDVGLDVLAEEYERLNPKVTVVRQLEDPSSSHLLDEVAAGRPLADLVVLEGRLGSFLAASDEFVDLNEHGAELHRAEQPEWAWKQATDESGRLIAYAVEARPVALCFRRDLLADAGIATDGDDLVGAVDGAGGDWAAYFELGRRYREATGRAWFDDAVVVWETMVRQDPEGWTSEAGDRRLRALWDLLAAAVADGLAATSEQWDWSGGQDLVDPAFATTPCEPAVLDALRRAAADRGDSSGLGWDVADVLPGGSAELGGAYLAVTAATEHVDEAVAFLDWAVEPEQQLTAARTTGRLPASRTAIARLADDAASGPVHGGAPVLDVMAARATDVVGHREAADEWPLMTAFASAVRELGPESDAAALWERAMTEAGRAPGA